MSHRCDNPLSFKINMEILHTGLHTILDKLVERICLKIKAYCWGKFFFPLFFIFSLTCYSVFFFFSLSSILLIMPLCYVLYVNFVIVCYLAFFLPVYVSISVTALVEVDFFLGGPDHQPCHPQHLVSSFVFIVFH